MVTHSSRRVVRICQSDPDDTNELVTTGAHVGQPNREMLGLQEEELPMAVASGEMFSDHERRLDVTSQKGSCATEENQCSLTLPWLFSFDSPTIKTASFPPVRPLKMFSTRQVLPTEHSPTGSVGDELLQNSYGKYELDAHVTDWIQVSRNESETAGANFGQGFQAWNTWCEALSTMEADGFDFSATHNQHDCSEETGGSRRQHEQVSYIDDQKVSLFGWIHLISKGPSSSCVLESGHTAGRTSLSGQLYYFYDANGVWGLWWLGWQPAPSGGHSDNRAFVFGPSRFPHY